MGAARGPQRIGGGNFTTLWRIALAFGIAALPVRAALATDVALTSAKSRATLRDRPPASGSALVKWVKEPALSLPLVPPLCPHSSTVEIATDAADTGAVPLPCANWRPVNAGYAYADPTAAAGGVARALFKGGKLLLVLKGAAYPAVAGPASYVEASLTVD